MVSVNIGRKIELRARRPTFAYDWFPSNSLSFQLCPIAFISIRLIRNCSPARTMRSIPACD